MELLAVLAILGALTAIVLPNTGMFVGRGKTESYEAEAHNIQTATMAMLTESTTKQLDPVTTATGDMDTVQTTDSPALVLSAYMVGLDPDGTVQSGCTYTFTAEGIITQVTP